MPRSTKPAQKSRSFLAPVCLLLVLGAALAGPVEPVRARPTDARDATLSWRVSDYAWTNLVLPAEEAATKPALKEKDAFVFSGGDGTYDPETGEAEIEFDGAVVLGKADPAGFRIRLSEPSLVLDEEGEGRLRANVSSCIGADCAGGWSKPVRAALVTFKAEKPEVSNGKVRLRLTPDYPSQNDPANPLLGQFPASFLTTLPAALQTYFKDTPADVAPPVTRSAKRPSVISLELSYGPRTGVEQKVVAEVTGGGAARLSATGSLSISVEGSEVRLPPTTFNSTTEKLVATGLLNPITVTDTRTSNPGWNVSGQVTEFRDGSKSFGGKYLGWTPKVISEDEGQEVTAGPNVTPGASGLSTPRLLGEAESGHGGGEAVLGGGLTLEVPLTTEPGTYEATLTITVI